MPVEPTIFDELGVSWAIIANTWWLWLPPILAVTAWNLWVYYLKARYFNGVHWVLLEVKIPRDLAKSPQAMEQVFAGLQSLYFGYDPLEKYWEGLQRDFVMFELVSMAGETRFYVRCTDFYKNVVEAQIYGQYPEAEIVEAEDYMNRLPEVVPSNEYNLFGIEFKLKKPDPYPLRTYVEFSTTETMKEEERKIDPFSSIVEMMGKLRPGEHAGYHIIMRPCPNDDWKVEGEKLVDKLIGKKTSEKPSGLAAFFVGIGTIVNEIGTALAGPAGEDAAPKRREEHSDATLMQHLSPGTKDIVAAIERNILKPAYEVTLRFCYIAPRDIYSNSHLASFFGGLKTYNTLTMNSLVFNSKAMATKVAWWWLPSWKAKRKIHKQQLFYSYYRSRKQFTDTWTLKTQLITLNTEELATIYHYPTLTAKGPLMPRIESKRSEPPATLPVG